MLKPIYLLLKNHLNSKVAALEHIDWFLNQFQQDDQDHVVITTGCYIRFLPIEWMTLSQNVQKAVLQFEIHLVNETAYGDERDMLDETYINHLQQEADIFKALVNQRFLLSDLSPSVTDDRVMVESIIRTRTNIHEEIDNLIRTSQTFQTTIWDYTATTSWQTIMAQIECDIEIVNSQ